MDKEIKCECGKLLGRVKGGKLYLWCKSCKKEVEIDVAELKKLKTD